MTGSRCRSRTPAPAAGGTRRDASVGASSILIAKRTVLPLRARTQWWFCSVHEKSRPPSDGRRWRLSHGRRRGHVGRRERPERGAAGILRRLAPGRGANVSLIHERHTALATHGTSRSEPHSDGARGRAAVWGLARSCSPGWTPALSELCSAACTTGADGKVTFTNTVHVWLADTIPTAAITAIGIAVGDWREDVGRASEGGRRCIPRPRLRSRAVGRPLPHRYWFAARRRRLPVLVRVTGNDSETLRSKAFLDGNACVLLGDVSAMRAPAQSRSRCGDTGHGRDGTIRHRDGEEEPPTRRS